MKNIIQFMLVSVLCLVLAVPVFAAGRSHDGMTSSTYRTNTDGAAYRTNMTDRVGTDFTNRVDNGMTTRGKMFNNRDGMTNDGVMTNRGDGFRAYNTATGTTGSGWGWLGLLGLLGLAGMFNRNRAR